MTKSMNILYNFLTVADLEGGRAGSGPPFGRQTDAVTVLLISNCGVCLVPNTIAYRGITAEHIRFTIILTTRCK